MEGPVPNARLCLIASPAHQWNRFPGVQVSSVGEKSWEHLRSGPLISGHFLATVWRAWADKIKSSRGAKTALLLDAIQRQPGEFSVADLQKECPGVSLDMIRHLCWTDCERKRWSNASAQAAMRVGKIFETR